MSAPTRPGDKGFVLDDSPIVIVPLIPEPPDDENEGDEDDSAVAFVLDCSPEQCGAVFGDPEADEEDRGDRQGGGA